MKDEYKIKLLEYWLENPDKVLEIPQELEGKVTKEDIAKLITEIEPSEYSVGGASLHMPPDYFKHLERIRKKLKEELEIESIRVQKEVIKKQMDLQKQLNEKYDETNSIMHKQNILTGILVIATIIIGIATIFISGQSNNIAQTQANISQIQTEILEISSAPYEPILRIWSPHSPLELSTQGLLKKRGQTEEVRVCIKNIGKTSTGHIYAQWQNNWTFPTSINILPGIESGETNCNWLELFVDGCVGDLVGCTEDVIPKGWTDLNLYVECDYCIPSKLNKTFRFCAWKKSSDECNIQTTPTIQNPSIQTAGHPAPLLYSLPNILTFSPSSCRTATDASPHTQQHRDRNF